MMATNANAMIPRQMTNSIIVKPTARRLVLGIIAYFKSSSLGHSSSRARPVMELIRI